MTDERESVYSAVWSRPVAVVAREWGVSDVALAKYCRRRNIPLPPRGYWARLRAGRAVAPRPELPPPRAKLTDEERRARIRETWARKEREQEERERAGRLPRARAALHEALDAVADVFARDGRVGMALHAALDKVLDAIDAWLRATEKGSVPSRVRYAAHGALDRVVNIAEKEQKNMAAKKPVISPKVAAALHAALSTVIDAINEPDAAKPKRYRGPYVRPPAPKTGE